MTEKKHFVEGEPAMKNIILLVCFAFFACLPPGTAFAAFHTFQPSQNDLYDLDHGKYYQWGINWQVMAGETIVGASLTFDNIRNYNSDPNDLWVHLLDSVSAGTHVGTDNKDGVDQFAGQGILLHHWEDFPSISQDITYDFSAQEIVTFMDYLSDGNFGFGLDPDCHYYNDGISFTVETSAVPIPSEIFLLGSGLLFLAGGRARRSMKKG